MAVTSIWAVHNSVKDVLDYAANPEKTENPNADDLKKLMDYAENPSKTEQRYLVSGVNCLPELAYERMTETKRQYGKPGGIVAYHGYMSFKPGEVTPKQCHEIGVELAKRLWGERFEVIVATHQDREHLHNHFVVNSVSFKDGAKFRCNKTYHRVLAEIIAEQENTSKDTVKRYIRLTKLVKPLLDMVDEGKIALTPAEKLSYLTEEEQQSLYELMQDNEVSPALSQAVKLKEMSAKGMLDAEALFEIMTKPKANQKETLKMDMVKLRDFFPDSTPKDMAELIFKILAEWRERNMEKAKIRRGREER